MPFFYKLGHGGQGRGCSTSLLSSSAFLAQFLKIHIKLVFGGRGFRIICYHEYQFWLHVRDAGAQDLGRGPSLPLPHCSLSASIFHAGAGYTVTLLLCASSSPYLPTENRNTKWKETSLKFLSKILPPAIPENRVSVSPDPQEAIVSLQQVSADLLQKPKQFSAATWQVSEGSVTTWWGPTSRGSRSITAREKGFTISTLRILYDPLWIIFWAKVEN